MCSPLPFNSILEIPANAVREKKIKVICIEKEDIKLSLFTNDKIICKKSEMIDRKPPRTDKQL